MLDGGAKMDWKGSLQLFWQEWKSIFCGFRRQMILAMAAFCIFFTVGLFTPCKKLFLCGVDGFFALTQASLFLPAFWKLFWCSLLWSYLVAVWLPSRLAAVGWGIGAFRALCLGWACGCLVRFSFWTCFCLALHGGACAFGLCLLQGACKEELHQPPGDIFRNIVRYRAAYLLYLGVLTVVTLLFTFFLMFVLPLDLSAL